MIRDKNMDIHNDIMQHKDNAHELERIYRQEPEAFKQAFASVWEQNPDSQVLVAWYERLYFQKNPHSHKAFLFQKDFIIMGVLAILAGIIMRIIFHFVEQEAIAPVNLVFGILPFIAIYFVYQNMPRKSVIYVLVSIFLISGIYINGFPVELTDAMVMAYLHMPIFLWVVVGLAYTGNEYRIGSSRLAYLKFNGEWLILYVSMAIAGILLTALTIQLFSFVGIDIADFYFRNVVLFGAVGLAIVAAYLVSSNLNLTRNIAPYLAKIFSPLVLVTLLVYLLTVMWIGRNPFLDRDFLITFNGILLIVLMLTLFTITESGNGTKKHIMDYINVALIALALIIDSVALSAIIFRLSAYGITPNRIAVLGANILIWANLIWMMFAYMRFLQNKARISAIQDAVTKYLPVYGLWAALVTLLFPLFF